MQLPRVRDITQAAPSAYESSSRSEGGSVSSAATEDGGLTPRRSRRDLDVDSDEFAGSDVGGAELMGDTEARGVGAGGGASGDEGSGASTPEAAGGAGPGGGGPGPVPAEPASSSLASLANLPPIHP